jgi:cytochrome c oxidase subunit 2
MFAQVIWFPPQASTTAASVDRLLYMLTTICGIVGLGVAVVLIYFAVRYRRRRNTPIPPEMRGNTPLELTWTITPMLIFIVFFFLGAIVYFDSYRAPDDATEVYVVGKQWMWKFQHPEGQREINELHVPVGQSFKLMMTSEDVIHSFFVPAFRVHMDVLPGRYSSVWFQPSQPGQYHLFCSQYCGTNHAGMVGTVYVMEPADYERWLHLSAEGSMALEGRKVFLKYRCISCHSADENARAPVLEDLYMRPVHLRDGAAVVADDDYIRESIYDPGKKIVQGWENLMPTFKGQVSPEEVNQLIAYFKSLNRGETPNRVEEFTPPVVTPPINTK